MAHRTGRSRRPGTRSSAQRLLAFATVAVAVLVLVAWRGGGSGPVASRSAAGSVASNETVALPPCRYADEVAAAGYDDWASTLLDTAFRLPKGYEPPDLVPVSRAGIAGSGQLRAVVIDDLAALERDAEQAGLSLRVVSAYRSEATQAVILAESERVAGRDEALKTSARPGHSEHQLGTAIDFGANGGADPWAEDWGGSPEGRWLAAHAADYGFVMSYPAAASPDRTCYSYEPWHFRYVGRERAAAIRDSGLSPREFLWRLGRGRPR